MQNQSMTRHWKTVLNVSSNGEKTRTVHAKSNSITTMRRIRSDSANVIRTGIQALSEDCCITNPDEILCRHHGTFPRMEHTYLTYMRQSVLGASCNMGFPFLCRNMMTASSFLAAKIAVCRATPVKAALPGWLSGKIILASLRYFFPPSPAGMPKQTTGTTRNKNACTLQADNVYQ